MASDPFLRRLERELRRGLLPLWVLEELAENGATYGYVLLTRLGARAAGSVPVVPSTLYPVLRELRLLGYIESFHGSESRGPVRKYYRLTAGGRRALGDARRVADRIVPALDPRSRAAPSRRRTAAGA